MQVVKAVEGRIPVLLDGGVRRGTDIFKALALGASGVFVSSFIIYTLLLSFPLFSLIIFKSIHSFSVSLE